MGWLIAIVVTLSLCGSISILFNLLRRWGVLHRGGPAATILGFYLRMSIPLGFCFLVWTWGGIEQARQTAVVLLFVYPMFLGWETWREVRGIAKVRCVEGG